MSREKIRQLREASRLKIAESKESIRNMPSVNPLLFLIIVHEAYLIACERCCEISYHELPGYDLIRTNSRSNQPIISRRVISNVSECKEFAASKKALAFNFVSARSRVGMRTVSN